MTDLALGTELTGRKGQRGNTSKTGVKLSADALLSVINDILDFSKIEARKVDLELGRFRPARQSGGTLRRSRSGRTKTGLELLCEIAPSVPDAVREIPTGCARFWLNLVGNAIKFTDQGEVTLNVGRGGRGW